MTSTRRYISLLCVCLVFLGCSSQDVTREQKKIVSESARYVETIFQEVQSTTALFSEKLKQDAKTLKNCKKPKESGRYSSMYYPQSAVVNASTLCFSETTKLSEKEWFSFFKTHPYVSWIYAFNSYSRLKRITPAVKMNFLFGPDLVFSSFYFFRDAVRLYPKVTWTAVGEDTNGTGRIIAVTQAIKLPGSHKFFTSMSIDVNLEKLFDKSFIKMRVFAQKNNIKHFFAFSYSKAPDGRIFIAKYTNDLSSWNMLAPKSKRLLDVTRKEAMTLRKFEHSVEEASTHVQTKRLSLRGKIYICTLARIRGFSLFTLACSSG